MCSCGHPVDDHHPNGHCLRCAFCPQAKRRETLARESWWRAWNADRGTPPMEAV